jgi:hypothetical protein
MPTHWFGYINVIILQDLAIAGLLWVAARLLKHVRHLRHVAEVQIQRASVDLNPARPALVHAGSHKLFSNPAVARRARAYRAAAG